VVFIATTNDVVSGGAESSHNVDESVSSLVGQLSSEHPESKGDLPWRAGTRAEHYRTRFIGQLLVQH
jgi:hypothetical protein